MLQFGEGISLPLLAFVALTIVLVAATALFATWAAHTPVFFRFMNGEPGKLDLAENLGAFIAGTLGVAATAAGACVAIYLAVLADKNIKAQRALTEDAEYREDFKYVNARLEEAMRPILKLARALSDFYLKMILGQREKDDAFDKFFEFPEEERSELLDQTMGDRLEYKRKLSRGLKKISNALATIRGDAFALSIFMSIARKRRTDHKLLAVDPLSTKIREILRAAVEEGTVLLERKVDIYELLHIKPKSESPADAPYSIAERRYLKLMSTKRLEEFDICENLPDFSGILSIAISRLEKEYGDQTWRALVGPRITARTITDENGNEFNHQGLRDFLELGYEIDNRYGPALLCNICQCVPRSESDILATLEELFKGIASMPRLQKQSPVIASFKDNKGTSLLGRSLFDAITELEEIGLHGISRWSPLDVRKFDNDSQRDSVQRADEK